MPFTEEREFLSDYLIGSENILNGLRYTFMVLRAYQKNKIKSLDCRSRGVSFTLIRGTHTNSMHSKKCP